MEILDGNDPPRAMGAKSFWRDHLNFLKGGEPAMPLATLPLKIGTVIDIFFRNALCARPSLLLRESIGMF